VSGPNARRPAVALDPGRVHAWRMERQLLGRSKAAAPEDAARQLVGVQAQVTSSAALAIALRSKRGRASGPPVAATTKALLERRLVRAWAMRGTLHLFAADDVPTIAAALRGKERWRRPAWLRWFGVSEAEMERLIDTIGGVLDNDRPMTRAELSVEIGGRLGWRAGELLRSSWGGALKVASDRHYLVQSAEGEAGVRFIRASRWLGAWREEEPRAALSKLVERYLAAYGPATLTELTRWWGVADSKVFKAILEDLGESLVEVQVGSVRAWARRAHVDAIGYARPTRGAVRLVGGFDPLIVGAGLREQLIPPAHRKRVSRTAGWISPVVLVDGIGAGIWDSISKSNELAITVELFTAGTARLRSAVAAAAERVGSVQGLSVTIAYGRVFDAPPGGAPFNDR
jgi:DNA glycosylase AlkZ-like